MMCLAPKMISSGVCLGLCVCVWRSHISARQGWQLYISRIHHSVLRIFSIFHSSCHIQRFRITLSGIWFLPNSLASVALVFTMKWFLSTPSNTATARHFPPFPLGSWSQYQTQTLLLFFCSSLRGEWMVATVKLSACSKKDTAAHWWTRADS